MANRDGDVADLLVISGIGSDLPGKTIFRALYRPEQRRLRWRQAWLSADS